MTTGVVVFAVLFAATGCTAQILNIFPEEKRQAVAIGKSIALSCQAEGPNPDLFNQPQWINPEGQIIPIPSFGVRPNIYAEMAAAKQTQLLYITAISSAMAGNYTCVATYSNNPVSSSVTLDTYVGITWNNANEQQYATEGKDFKVMCDVTAEPAPTVDWLREGRAIVTGGRYVVHTNGLLIKTIERSDTGSYSCRVVVMRTGELIERVIHLEVLVAPEILNIQKYIQIKEGESADIKCPTTGSPPPRITWTKTSTHENLSATSRFSVDEITGTLHFDRAEAGDYGKFTCTAQNMAGSTDAEVTVDILVKPKIFELFNTSSPEKQEGQLICKAIGRPAPYVSFRKLGDHASYANGPNENGRIVMDTFTKTVGDQMQSEAVLTISNLTRADDGLYECIANSKGEISRKFGLLTVQFRPSFENMPKEPIWTWNRQPANLTCLAESIPNATIKWKHHEKDLVESHLVRIYGSGPFSYVTVIPTEASLYGHYKCVATNPLGEAVHSVELREAFVPGRIAQVQQEKLTATTVSFTINGPAEDMGPPILAYTVQYKENGNNDWNLAMNRTWSVGSPYIVENLKPMVTYDLRFAAVNQVGGGQWAFPMVITMPKRSPPETPKWRDAISSESLIHTKLTDRFELKWKIPYNNGEPILKYHVTYCQVLKVSGDWRVATNSDCVNEELKSPDAINYEILGLRPDTRYRIELRAYNVLGSSTPAHLFLQTALGVDPAGMAPRRLLSAGSIIGLAVAGVLLLLFLVDLILLCCKQTGVMASLCNRKTQTHKDEESKLGSTKPRAPPSPAPLPPPVKLATTPTDEKEPLKEFGNEAMKRNSSVEFDGHRAYSTSGGPITGKNSAV